MENRTDMVALRAKWLLVVALACFPGLTSIGHASNCPFDGSDPKVESPSELLDLLQDSSYRKRRDAFLKLCDPNVAVDEFLEAESKKEDLHRSRIATWLLKLRRSSGSVADKFELLAVYQKVMSGDFSSINQLAMSGQWQALIDLLQLIPPNVLTEAFRELRMMEAYVDRAWTTGNEWAVPKLMDTYFPQDGRVGLNRWWRSLGMPENWKVTEQDDPRTTVYRLEADGRINEALQLARDNRLRRDFEKIALRSGAWDSWVDFANQNSATPADRFQAAYRRWMLALATRRLSQLEEEWNTIKASTDKQTIRGRATMALIMNDQAEYYRVLDQMKPEDAFDVLYAQGKSKEAFEKVGITEFTAEACKKWALDHRQMFQLILNNPNSRVEIPKLMMFSIAFHHLGIPEAENAFDDVWRAEVQTQEVAIGPEVLSTMLSIWNTTNQRNKALQYLKDYSKRNSRAVIQWLTGKSTSAEDRRSDYGRLLDILFGNHIFDSQTVLSAIMTLETKGSTSERVEMGLDILEELYQGRRPTGWENAEPLQDLFDLASKEQENPIFLMRDFAVLYELMGDPEKAIELLTNCLSMGGGIDDEIVITLTDLLIKVGQSESAANLLVSLMERSDKLVTHLLATKCLEKLGRFEDLERLRLRKFSSVFPDVQFNDVSQMDDREIFSQPDLELFLDRTKRISWSPLFNDSTLRFRVDYTLRYRLDSLLRYRIARHDISKSEAAVQAATARILKVPDEGIATDADLRTMIRQSAGSFALQAVKDKNLEALEFWMGVARRVEPGHIDLPIDVLQWADKFFPKETVDSCFDLFWKSLSKHLEDMPKDAMTLNNLAWMAAQCNRRLDQAVELSRKAVELKPDPTYLDTLADIEFRLGNVREAIDISQKCRLIEPRESQHRTQLRRFHKALNGDN